MPSYKHCPLLITSKPFEQSSWYAVLRACHYQWPIHHIRTFCPSELALIILYLLLLCHSKALLCELSHSLLWIICPLQHTSLPELLQRHNTADIKLIGNWELVGVLQFHIGTALHLRARNLHFKVDSFPYSDSQKHSVNKIAIIKV